MRKLFVAIILLSSLFLSGCANLNPLITLAGLAASGYGIYKAFDK